MKKKKYNKSGFGPLKGHELETVGRCGVGTEYVYSERKYGKALFTGKIC